MKAEARWWNFLDCWERFRGRVSMVPASTQENLGAQKTMLIPGYGEVIVGHVVNAVGDSCPKPQILTLKAVNQVPPGSVVELISDNVTAVETIPAMMEAALGMHLMTMKVDKCWHVFVCKSLEKT